jgi:hypothetical protein
MMVVSGKPDRVLWIDFDSAQTLPENEPLTPMQQGWVEMDILRMDYFVKGLVCSRWVLTDIILIVHPRPKTMQKEN